MILRNNADRTLAFVTCSALFFGMVRPLSIKITLVAEFCANPISLVTML